MQDLLGRPILEPDHGCPCCTAGTGARSRVRVGQRCVAGFSATVERNWCGHAVLGAPAPPTDWNRASTRDLASWRQRVPQQSPGERAGDLDDRGPSRQGVVGVPAAAYTDACLEGDRYATVLAPHWTLEQATEFNGAVCPCLGSAVWAVRTTDSYENAVRGAVDLGGDTDTVAAVIGALAGAVYGIAAIPRSWTEPLHATLLGAPGPQRVLRLRDLETLAGRLLAASPG